MKNKLMYMCFLMMWVSCKKSASTSSVVVPPFNGTVTAYTPVSVTKTSAKKIFAHYMPWFETPAYSNYGTWGQHWTMTNQTPPASIASWYYPSVGPYASGDTAVVDYQLLLMKLSGIDGVFIDWPGTLNYSDYALTVANTNVLVSRLAAVGLKYAIVYEDQNLQYVSPSNQANQIAQAQADMNYIQTNYFASAGTTYETFNGKPLLLDFGPFGPLQTSSEWNTIFSVMTTPPAFFAYEGSSGKGGTNAEGEFAWVQQSNLTNLNSFYSNSYSGEKVSVAYPGFNTFYAAGGWPGPTWTLPYNSGGTTTFGQTLSLALQQPGDYIQLVTWNDYGEGTMIEPTTQFGYSYLTTLQQQLGVQPSLSQSDLEAVAQLYQLRASNASNAQALAKLDQVYYYMASLQMSYAKGLLSEF